MRARADIDDDARVGRCLVEEGLMPLMASSRSAMRYRDRTRCVPRHT